MSRTVRKPDPTGQGAPAADRGAETVRLEALLDVFCHLELDDQVSHERMGDGDVDA